MNDGRTVEVMMGREGSHRWDCPGFYLILVLLSNGETMGVVTPMLPFLFAEHSDVTR